MSKKQVEKLINKIDVENKFDEINSKIDYDKYVKVEEKAKKPFRLNPFAGVAVGIVAAYALVLGVLMINHSSVQKYNKNLANEILNTYNVENKSLYKIEDSEDFNMFVSHKYVFKSSMLNKIADFLDFDWAVKNQPNMWDEMVSVPEMNWGDGLEEEVNSGTAMPGEPGDTSTPEDSYGTNVQEEGIDEADISKCDGRYIYVYNSELSRLNIFDLNAELVTFKDVRNNNVYVRYGVQIYVNDENVILTSPSLTYIYEFDGSNLTLIDSFTYTSLIDSRLTNDTLYLISYDKFNKDQYEYEETYYDGISEANLSYSLVKYDLNSNTYKEANDLNSYTATFYMSENNLYLINTSYTGYKIQSIYNQLGENASNICNQISTISIFDYNLNAVGSIRLAGSILNQFSIDEHNNYLRVVSTNTSMPVTKLNAISIYDLSTLQRVGYLDQDIGLDRQIVKSVRYDNDTCYVVTYENTDPLYEIDLTDVTAPKIVSVYKAPGWSNYLHTFEINGEKYLFGIGYDDDRITRKISVYKNDETTSQIGKDFKISWLNVNPDLYLEDLYQSNLNNHKALFIYNDGENLYLGVSLTQKAYYIFKIDVDAENVVSIYKTVTHKNEFIDSRCYLINGYMYVTQGETVHKEEF